MEIDVIEPKLKRANGGEPFQKSKRRIKSGKFLFLAPHIINSGGKIGVYGKIISHPQVQRFYKSSTGKKGNID